MPQCLVTFYTTLEKVSNDSSQALRKRVLVVCMFDAVHAGRWLEQFRETNADFILFPSSPHRRVHPKIKGLLASTGPAFFKLAPFLRAFGLPLWVLDKLFSNRLRGLLLRLVQKSFQPQIVHVLELTNAGYIALRAFQNTDRNFKLISTNWGSDIHWFSRFPKHRRNLKQLLQISDAYSCECQRDVQLAKELGFRGNVLPVIPNAGGFNSLSRPLRGLAERDLILVKGYHGWSGRAKTALAAIAELDDELTGSQVLVFSANFSTVLFAKRKLRHLGRNLRIHRKFALRHEQLLDLFSRARIYVGLSVTDGISTSMLEAMAMGAIPVQTTTSCCNEWFSDTGVAIREITVDAVKSGIVKALQLSKDPGNARKNLETVRLNADAEKVTAIARSFYDL